MSENTRLLSALNFALNQPNLPPNKAVPFKKPECEQSHGQLYLTITAGIAAHPATDTQDHGQSQRQPLKNSDKTCQDFLHTLFQTLTKINIY